MRPIFVLIALGLPLAGMASELDSSPSMFSSPESCSDTNLSGPGDSGVQQFWSASRRVCSVKHKSGGLKNPRQQVIAVDSGQILIFADDPLIESNSKGTAARAVFLLPRGAPVAIAESEESFTLGLPDGHELVFDRRTGEPVRYSGGKISREVPASLANAGGISLVSTYGVTIDCGVKRGESPMTEPARVCTVLSRGKSCSRVRVSDLVSSADPGLLKTTDARLADVLREKCPELDFSVLADSTHAHRSRLLESVLGGGIPDPLPSSAASPDVRLETTPAKAGIPEAPAAPVAEPSPARANEAE